MRQKTTDVSNDLPHKLLRYGILLILALVPFHASITVWLASLGLNYDLIRLWKEFILFGLAILSLIIVYKSKKFSEWFASDNLIKLILVFIAFATLNAFVVLLNDSVNPRAVGFGLIVDTRMLIMLLVVMLAIKAKIFVPIPKWVVLPAIAVIGFGLMQMSVLPNDFLSNIGYSDTTIKSYQYIDNNPDFPRAQSTLRGPNPLGAYLTPLIMLLIVGVMKYKRYKWQFVIAVVAGLTVMFGTHSRSAWIGLALSLGLFAGWQVKGKMRQFLLVLAGAVILIGGVGVYLLRDNDVVQNVVFHSSEKSPSAFSSNERRAGALQEGIDDIISNPLGGGIGSAGPASVHNGIQKQSENFYVQIGRELGVIGLSIYIAITAVIIYRLWALRSHLVVQATLAAFIGLIAVNMLSHAWSDDTLAYVFGAMLAYSLVAYKKAR